jgi:excisionase family DNA binding protein
MSEQLLRPSDAAKLIAVSRSKLYALAQSGELPGVVRLPGGSVRILQSVLEAWLVEQASDGVQRAPAPLKVSALEADRVSNHTPPRPA